MLESKLSYKKKTGDRKDQKGKEKLKSLKNLAEVKKKSQKTK